ncbi:GIY-YIG nuclease family protein [Thalassoglobus polymorphus]|uniref:GIY-YIG domain-containing protein n=1 Tax=Thalassoglobus polymorphus TaxID=2527994 RepID=A0A517QQN2_9PLAN|nr:GIY-YIG nuclease family protein [Thalassoglobus polymorphus]QDT33941.1 hypothetical protein Mal48_31980 [Thalassoglobus polymorphus]
MHSIPKSPGVYVLVFYLPRKTAITFDRKGAQHKFLPGWYLYVGSACGPGGLDRRLARHKRQHADGKRMHWNVDYFREHALLCEIWYSENADSNVEHQWAKALIELPTASVPVAKFGANDCREKCPSHFFHAPDRPSTAVFRKALATRICSTEVFVEFIKEPRRTKKVASGLQRECFDGRRFLEVRRRVAAESKSPLCEWFSLAMHCPARQLAEQIATQTKTTFPKLKRAIQFANAVETLIENCGHSVMPALFDPVRPQSRGAILFLSRTSDVRQRHRINGVIEGRFRSIAPQPDDMVFDTVKFGEVLSRLARARGSLEKLQHRVDVTCDRRLLAESKCLSRLSRLAATRLKNCVNDRVDVSSAVPGHLGKEAVISILKSSNVQGRTIGMARLALRLIVKNLWDFEEMTHRGLLPTDNELQAVECEVERIQRAARNIEQKAEIQNDLLRKESHVTAA